MKETVLTVNGDIVDGKASALDYVLSEKAHDGEVRVILLLPDAVLNAAESVAAARRNGSETDRTLAALGGGGGSVQAVYPFVVDIISGTAPEIGQAGQSTTATMHETFSMSTELNECWLSKPFLKALIDPALEAYFKANVAAPRVSSPEMVKMTIGG